MSNLEEKVEALMEAVEVLLQDNGFDYEAVKLYKARTEYNSEDE